MTFPRLFDGGSIMNEKVYPGDTVYWFALKRNRREFTPEELLPYEGTYVAWSLDGKQ